MATNKHKRHYLNSHHVVTKKNTVFIKTETDEWYPINFQWISVVNLQNEMSKT